MPDPFREIRVLDVRDVPGANFWSSRAVTRIDLHPGRYDDISSAEVPGFTDRLLEALPGLAEHRCSIGAPGGFVTRLRRGTYVPHIVEHVALELQAEVGHEVGFGRARGGDREGEYTVVVERLLPGVGRAAALTAVEIVRRLLAGAPVGREAIHSPVRKAAGGTAPVSFVPRGMELVMVGGTASVDRYAAAGAVPPDAVLLDYAALLRRGVLVRNAAAGIVLDLDPAGLPPRYREAERLHLLASVAADAVRRGGTVVVPAAAEALAGLVLRAGRHPVPSPAGIRPLEALRLARGRIVEDEAAQAG